MSTAHLSKLPPATPQGEPVVAHLGARLQVTGRNLALAGAPCGALLTLSRRSDARESAESDAGMAPDSDCWWPSERAAAARLHTLLARPRQVLEYLGAVPLVEPNVPTRTDLLRRRSEFRQTADGSWRKVAVVPEHAATGRRFRDGHQPPRPVDPPAGRVNYSAAEPRYLVWPDRKPAIWQLMLPLPPAGDGTSPTALPVSDLRAWGAQRHAEATRRAQVVAFALLALAHPTTLAPLLVRDVRRQAQTILRPQYRRVPAGPTRAALARAIARADDAGLPGRASRLRAVYRRAFTPTRESVQASFDQRAWSNLMRHSR